MTLEQRDKRALVLLAVTAFLVIGWWISTPDEKVVEVVGAQDSIPVAERRLARLRQASSIVPGREKMFLQVKEELAQREAGLIQADTAAQAQAQLLEIITRVARAQTPPVQVRSREIGQVKPYGDQYGEVSVAVNFDLQIEQLVNFLADLTSQKVLMSTTDLRIGAANPKQKTMPVRLTISGLVRRELIPDKKGVATF